MIDSGIKLLAVRVSIDLWYMRHTIVMELYWVKRFVCMQTRANTRLCCKLHADNRAISSIKREDFHIVISTVTLSVKLAMRFTYRQRAYSCNVTLIMVIMLLAGNPQF